MDRREFARLAKHPHAVLFLSSDEGPRAHIFTGGVYNYTLHLEITTTRTGGKKGRLWFHASLVKEAPDQLPDDIATEFAFRTRGEAEAFNESTLLRYLREEGVLSDER